MNTEGDSIFMQRCIDLAGSFLGETAPNPLVGAVLVCNNRVIGEGAHVRFGAPHAEVAAIRNALGKDGSSAIAQSALFVNLEPCTHFGKTPPCTELIIRSGIKKVVIGTRDPNPQVNGNGIRLLKEAGVEIKEEVLAGKCRELNRRFFCHHELQRPYIILKWAESSNGFISGHLPDERQISNVLSQKLVHQWRSQEQAIMVGTHTASTDNPRLNVRYWKGRNPLRVVIDKELTLPPDLCLFDGSSPTLIYNEKKKIIQGLNEFVQADFSDALSFILRDLCRRNIQSLIVEGGKKLLDSFISRGLWDEARIFRSEKILSGGVPAPAIDGTVFSREMIGNDRLTVLRSK